MFVFEDVSHSMEGGSTEEPPPSPVFLRITHHTNKGPN